MIPGSSNPLMMAAAPAGGYQVSRSLRFNSSDSGFLSPVSTGTSTDRRKGTISFWVKRSLLSVSQTIWRSYDGSSPAAAFFAIDGNNQLQFSLGAAPTNGFINASTAIFRDPSAWYHFVTVWDTTLTTPDDRMKIYVNGAQITVFSSRTNPTQNSSCMWPLSSGTFIGTDSSSYFSGYLADVHFIDGQALTPSSFTEVSATTGQLIPKAYSGTFGTNGFWLKFSDNSAATAAALGKDYSGNNNDWTPNNFSVSTSAINYSNNNQVTGSYTSGWTTGYGPEKMFDGNLATYTNQVDTGPGGAVAYLYWSPSPTIGVNSLRIYGLWFKAGQNPYIDYDQVSINGNPYVGNAGATATFAWWDLTSYLTTYSITTITNITFQRTPIGGNRVDPNNAAIEVNGSILINAAPADNDSLVDTPTSFGTDTYVGGEVRGNYATLNPLEYYGGTTAFTNGNLEVAITSASGSGPYPAVRPTINPFNQGAEKFYSEITIGSKTSVYQSVGANIKPDSMTGSGDIYVIWRSDGLLGEGGVSATRTGTGVSYTNGDIIGVTYNNATLELKFYKNNSLVVTWAFTTIPALFNLFCGTDSSTGTGNFTWNFGQRAFSYTAPTNFKALCDTNLPSPVVAKPNTVMDVVLYTGNSGTQVLPNASSTPTSLNFSPGFLWIKTRSVGYYHVLTDKVRGDGKIMFSNTATIEETTNRTALGTNNFTLIDDGSELVNHSPNTHVAWVWDAGTTTASNGSGSITSQVRANVSAGFSVVTYTGNGANATVGHGLGVQPQFLIFRCRDTSGDNSWWVSHIGIGLGSGRLILNQVSSADSSGAGVLWNSTAPTSTVFSIGNYTGINQSTLRYVAYCFASVVGYSNGFSYTGNGAADGSFVYLGFRPRLIMLKRSDSTSNWTLLDTSREGYNVDNDPLYPNLSNAEGTTDLLDITSNGFKLRSTDASVNASAGTYIGFAWAENPFQYARAR